MELPNRQESFSCLFASCCVRRGDSERCLKELQRRAQAAAISTDPRDGHETLRLLLLPPRSLCASTGHSPHRPSREPVQPATAGVPGSRDNFPGRMHCAPQAGATSRRPRPLQARPASSVPLPPPGLSEPAPEAAAPLNLSCLSEEQTPSGDLLAEAGPNPKLKPRSCANKEEKGKFLPAASGAED